MAALLALLLIIAIVMSFFIALSVRIVRPYQRGIVERLGKFKAVYEPGLRMIIPFVDRMIKIDMREQVVDVPPQEVITSDNVIVTVDAVVYYEPTDPVRLVYNVANFFWAVTKLAQTNLRNVIGDMQLDEALTSRDKINAKLRDVLDDATDKWGTRVVRVEIQRIDPPPDVAAAMHNQMKAERNRRAVVTEAQGVREAAITKAEGEKQAAILVAEGNKQKQILEAEGQAQAIREVAEAERFRRETVALGEAAAIREVFGSIHDGNPTPDLLAVKYLEALASIADGRATKIFLPLETSGILGAVAGMGEIFRQADGESRAVDREGTAPEPPGGGTPPNP